MQQRPLSETHRQTYRTCGSPHCNVSTETEAAVLKLKIAPRPEVCFIPCALKELVIKFVLLQLWLQQGVVMISQLIQIRIFILLFLLFFIPYLMPHQIPSLTRYFWYALLCVFSFCNCLHGESHCFWGHGACTLEMFSGRHGSLAPGSHECESDTII